MSTGNMTTTTITTTTPTTTNTVIEQKRKNRIEEKEEQEEYDLPSEEYLKAIEMERKQYKKQELRYAREEDQMLRSIPTLYEKSSALGQKDVERSVNINMTFSRHMLCSETPSLRVTNVVTKVNPLESITNLTLCKGSELNLKRFAAAIWRVEVNKESPALLLFASGSAVCAGAKSTIGAQQTIAKAQLEIKKSFGHRFVFGQFEVTNVVGTARCAFSLDMRRLFLNIGIEGNYDPEKFPGLSFNEIELKVKILIFPSGCAIITGATTENTLRQAWENVYRNFLIYFAIPKQSFVREINEKAAANESARRLQEEATLVAPLLALNVVPNAHLNMPLAHAIVDFDVDAIKTTTTTTTTPLTPIRNVAVATPSPVTTYTNQVTLRCDANEIDSTTKRNFVVKPGTVKDGDIAAILKRSCKTAIKSTDSFQNDPVYNLNMNTDTSGYPVQLHHHVDIEALKKKKLAELTKIFFDESCSGDNSSEAVVLENKLHNKQ
jgi:TATA-box binding protein (TBP) (component of TFIID and TFIIIB)